MAAEGTAVHLLLPADWFWPKVIVGVLHLYGVAMLVSWAVSQRTQPHRLHAGRLELRVGQTYRAGVATAGIASAKVTRRRDGARTGLDLTGETPRLAVAGRTDVLLRFTEPLRVDRPLGDPVTVTELAVAADDPERLVRAITGLAERIAAPGGAALAGARGLVAPRRPLGGADLGAAPARRRRRA